MSGDRPLPNAKEAELALLCAVLKEPAQVLPEVPEIAPGDFYNPLAGDLWRIILALHKEGTAIDPVTLAAEYPEDKADDLRALVSKVLDSEAGFSANAATYAEAIREAKRRRGFIQLAHQMNDGAYEKGADVDHMAREVIRQLNASIPARPVASVLEFLRPSELRDYSPPDGIVLVGDCHIVRGNPFVIGGPPGVGKSRAAVALAVAGATGADWFKLPVPVRFRTMIVQNENGRFRLQREFAGLDCPALEDFVRVCPPPPLGLAFDKAEFQAALAAAIDDFKPDVIVVDPWNAVARDDKAKDYLETFNAIRAVIPTGDTTPALGIVHHTRKPKGDERATGRGLLNLLAGSYVLGSVPRSVFVMQAASDDPTDNRVVWTCCKNNDGELGGRSAWERRNGLFAPVADFDWTEFDRPASDRPTVTEADVAEVFQHGKRSLRRAEVVVELQKRTSAGKSACYNALKLDGRFARHLAESEGLLTWIP